MLPSDGPSLPIETYLRLMFLKCRYRLGFEPLCREVSDSISWQRFCRIPLGVAVPHPTTLMKITTRCGTGAVDGLNEALLAKAAGAKVLKTDKVRADTTVVPADVAYPTDSGLLAKGVAKMAKAVKRLQGAGLAVRTPTSGTGPGWFVLVPARSAPIFAGGRARQKTRSWPSTLTWSPSHRRRSTRHAGWLPTPSAPSAASATHAPRKLEATARETGGHRYTGRSGRRPDPTTALRARPRTVRPGLVSLHDPDARPIRNGRLGKPVEFGYKAQVVDNEDGVVIDHNVEMGNPPDAPMLVPAIERVTARTRNRVPKAVTADRGYGEAAVGDALTDLGVDHRRAPDQGQTERIPATSSNSGRHSNGWSGGEPAAKDGSAASSETLDGTEPQIDGLQGARIWCGHGVFNHNLVKIAALVDAE